MIVFATIQVSIGLALTVALIWNNVRFKNRMRKCDEEIDKIVERVRKDT